MVLTGTILAVILLAAMIESTFEYVVGIWWKPWAPEKRKSVIQLLSLIAGIAIAFMGKLDILALIGVNIPIVGILLTGGLIGRGSDAVHQFINQWIPQSGTTKTTTTSTPSSVVTVTATATPAGPKE